MSKVLVTESYLADIGNAIREKNGEATLYKPSEMAEAISNIPSGSSGNTNMVIYLSQYSDTEYKAPYYVPKNKTWAEIAEVVSDIYIKRTTTVWSYLGSAQIYYDADGENPVLPTDSPEENTQYFCN